MQWDSFLISVIIAALVLSLYILFRDINFTKNKFRGVKNALERHNKNTSRSLHTMLLVIIDSLTQRICSPSNPGILQIKMKFIKAEIFLASLPSASSFLQYGQPACSFLRHLILAHTQLYIKS